MSSVIFSLLDTPAYGGAEQYLLSVLFSAVRNGHKVILATNNPQVLERCAGKIEVRNLPYRLDAIGNWKGLVKYFWALPGAILWLILTLKKLQKETVCCVFPGYTDRLSFSPIIKLLGLKLIWLEYGPLEPTFARNFCFPKILYAIGRPFPDTVVTISQWTKRSLITTGKIQEKKIHVIYPGVEINGKREKVKRKELLIVVIARLAKEKEIDLLLRAWQKMDRKEKKLVIIGDGPERENLEQLTEILHISGSVKFVGFVSEKKKRSLVAQSDLFVFPSSWELEGFGMTTIEAMALGVPVLTSGFGPQAEIISDGVTGWIFSPHTATALAQRIRQVFSSPRKATIREAGRRLVSERFSQERFYSEWRDVLKVQ